MNQGCKGITYLVRTPHGYCFRYQIPPDLQGIVGKKEIRYSLKTGYVGKAKTMSQEIAVKVKRLMRDLRAGRRKSTMNSDQIQQLIASWIRDTLAEEEAARTLTDKPTSRRVPLSEEALDERWEAFDSVQALHREALAKSDHVQAMEHRVGLLLEKHGIELDKDSDAYLELCRGLLKASIQVLEVEKDRTFGRYDQTDEEVVQEACGFSIKQEAKLPQEETCEEASALVSEVFQKYQSENMSSGVLAEKTSGEIGTSIQLFIDVQGDLPLGTIQRKTVVDYKDTLMRLPANLRKDPRYRDKTIPEILALDGVEPMAPRTLNKQLGRVSSLFTWAVQNGYMQMNPADGLKVKLGRHVVNDREPFSQDDLQRLFLGSPEYREDGFTKSFQFWLPVLGLFTGCRLDELCQLHLEDIRLDHGVWVLDINDGPGKKLKNTSSRRLVPLHPVLAEDLNLPGRVEWLRHRGETRLFPELPQGRDGYSKNASQWFNRRYRQRLGVDKPFHSFRHTFIGHLKDKMVDPVMLQEVAGHTVDSMTFGTYSRRYQPDKVYEELILKINFELDLRYLKSSRWVVI